MVESMVTNRQSSFTQAETDAVYRAIRERRDVRSGYLPRPLENDVLLRLLTAAHRAPSVGLMQPWRFIVIRDTEQRARVREIFLRAREAAAALYEGDRRELYARLKLEALLEAPQHLCVVCDANSEQGHALGRHSMPETPAYSVVCAIQNLWLAARAEDIGVGWVSILDPLAMKDLLRIPPHVELVAYLCIGYVEEFAPRPDLERVGWEERASLASVLRDEFFDRPTQLGEQAR
ncbi:MAG: 5,6-dimethylbenzimidazole synthase [Terracidiphilus sp.]